MTGQWPLNISGAITDPQLEIDQAKSEFYQGSEALQTLVRELSPRYVYSSNSDIFFKREPFLSNAQAHTRFIGLGSVPGKHKPEGSKTTYI